MKAPNRKYQPLLRPAERQLLKLARNDPEWFSGYTFHAYNVKTFNNLRKAGLLDASGQPTRAGWFWESATPDQLRTLRTLKRGRVKGNLDSVDRVLGGRGLVSYNWESNETSLTPCGEFLLHRRIS